MARTIGRKRRLGETGTALCDYCGTRWNRSDLYRDSSGLLTCPQEGRGRDTVELTRANVASARSYAHSYDRPMRFPGSLDNETVEPIDSVTGNILAEDGTPITAEDGTYVLRG